MTRTLFSGDTPPFVRVVSEEVYPGLTWRFEVAAICALTVGAIGANARVAFET